MHSHLNIKFLFLSLCCCDWCDMHVVPLVCFGFHVKTSLHSNCTVVPYCQTLTVFPVATSSPRVESPRSMTDSPSACKGPLEPPFSWLIRSLFNVKKNPTRCNSMQIFIYCKVTLCVSDVTAPIIRSTKNCNCSLQYRSYCKIQGLTGMN